MGLKILHLGQITDLTGTKYEPQNYGRMRLNIRTSSGNTGIKKYGLATSVEQTSDARVRLRVNGQKYYIGTSSSSTRQSNYTSYSSYYTYTYTQQYSQTQQRTYQQTYPRSSVLTRQGTQTTATRTQPAKYTYRASYYTGYISGYTVSTRIKWDVQTAWLSGTRASNYNATRTASRSSQYTVSYYLTWGRSDFVDEYQEARVGNNYVFSKQSFAGWRPNDRWTNLMYKESNIQYGAGQTTGSGGPYPIAKTSEIQFQTNNATYRYTSSHYGTANVVARYANTTSRTINTIQSTYRYHTRTYWNMFWAFVTASRSSQYNSEYVATRASTYYSTAPNYVWLGASQAGAWAAWVGAAVSAGAYKYSYVTDYYSEAHVANQSYRRVTRHRETATSSSSTKRVGEATLTSTNTPIGGVPSNYTLSNGPAAISTQASYTYTDAGCTRTYASNYSTSYWTVTSTLTSTQTNWYTGTYNSSPYYRSSLGSTATSRASNYTVHNFV